MAKIETLNEIVSTLNYEGHHFLAAQLEEEIKRRKENYSKQKERRKNLSKRFDNEILQVIKDSWGDLSADEIANELIEKGITKNPVTKKPINSRSVSIRCTKMYQNGIIKKCVDRRERIVNKEVFVFCR